MPKLFKSSGVSTADIQSWEQAHELCCRRRKSITASPRDVIDELYKEGDEILWEIPNKDNVVVPDGSESSVQAVLSRLKKAPESRSEEGRSGGFSFFKSTRLTKSVSHLYNAVVGLDPEFDAPVKEYKEEPNDVSVNPGISPEEQEKITREMMATTVLNVDIASQCVQAMISKLEAILEEEPLVLLREGTGPGTWQHWCSAKSKDQDPFIQDVLAQVSPKEMDFLLSTMAKTKLAHVVSRPGNPDMVVLTPTETDDMDRIELRVALHDIDTARCVAEEQLDKISERIKASTKRAMQYKKSNQKNKALNELKHRKILAQRQESTQNQILKLEETRSALVQSSSNKDVVETLSTANSALKQMREAKEESANNLNNELYHVQDVDSSMLSNADLNIDEDELMDELSVLTGAPERDLDEEQLQLQARLAALSLPSPTKTKPPKKAIKSKLPVAVLE